jgi:hypothetical protein
MENLENILMMITVFGSGILVIYILARYNYLVKKALAEKGITPTTLKISYPEIGSIVIGLGLGLAGSSVFTLFELAEDTMDLLVWSVILVGGGLGLFYAQKIRQRLEKGE